ncbi:hypothetical protein BGZ61DRAFT_588687 [Ilyonectria robusta]|uniref:uncharacterized protein n=1 Tax=Ilyonectria robusta TaxID=1079257 RepID=UPI001E8DB5BB|nr:uncharacterized protein BGZ61DRAFT_588687 [Ilyonectria robusta]KAH8694809.1 hypothetical protein BGZ61DRAFT_588687 [Ilyonectria robusta]
MLSHLRFHRRGHSNPPSPLPDQHPTSPPSSLLSPYSPDAFSPDLRQAASNPVAQAPTLPPITRVTSAESEREPRRDADMTIQPDPRAPPPRSPYNSESSFIGGVALRKYRRDMAAQSTDTIDSARGTPQSTLAPVNPPAPLRPPPQPVRNSKQPASFSTPTDLHNSAASPTGRRPAGARLHTELPTLSTTSSNSDNPKPKKGLPFLKNPMSTLLMRRKNSQQVPNLVPLPLKNRPEEPMYDPRIKGTRVHDFSAPRPKRVIPSTNRDPAYVLSPSQSGTLPELERFPNTIASPVESGQASATSERNPSNASASVYSQDSLKPTLSNTSDMMNGTANAILSPPQHAPPVPPKNEGPISVQPRSSQASRLIDDAGSVYSKSSTRVGRSRGPSLSGLSGKDIPSALPRHMKSTSSRFSFDMVGAAKQEKLLEDRHRQRELEKQTTEPDPPSNRDSRYDDFDEDGFDYDAMMDDDEYPEEEINMVGDDIDYLNSSLGGGLGSGLGGVLDDELDPDDDQENFSGFVFQRSNPTSTLTSPLSAGFIATPRDAEGNAIGFAMSKNSPGLPDSLSPNLLSPHMLPNSDLQAAGLGIQGLDIPGPTSLESDVAFQQHQQLPTTNAPQPGREDDTYYDDELMRYENQEFAEDLAAPPEWDDTPFDESIFDNNDTDQFGRPIAGAFAQAQEDRRAGQQDVQKRESDDITSRFSAHSDVSQSTAHTSLSVNGQKPADEKQPEESTPSLHSSQSPVASKGEELDGDSVAAYQAALAAAANKAALSGKFQRTSSPRLDEPPSSEMGQSPDTPGHGTSFEDDIYEDDGYSYENMADFELDDDAIIAEANASALANDSDGWYGQEFGFYSAPGQQYGSHNPNQSVEYEFSNGGFFGPKGGVDRSTSGRMVSREPNLTPITERSEYSNRNSMMSLNMPGFSSGTPIQSPGLAQLALLGLGDRGDEMSLSALLRLRSKAWGSSQVSLASSQGSPRSERGDAPNSPWGATFSSPTSYHARKNSVLSTVSQDSDDNCSVSGSPTLTGGIPGFTPSLPPVPPLMSPGAESPVNMGASTWNMASSPPSQLNTVVSPLTDSVGTPFSPSAMSPLERHKSSDSSGSNGPSRHIKLGHRHNASADSISYTKEEEDSGATRWVLERRRTGEAGQEILEREVVEGGRI